MYGCGVQPTIAGYRLTGMQETLVGERETPTVGYWLVAATLAMLWFGVSVWFGTSYFCP
jgi:hypothetical protein